MSVKATINGTILMVMLDTGVDGVYMAKKLADEIGLRYTKATAYAESANSKFAIIGKAYKVKIRIGQWEGKTYIYIASIDKK